MKTSLRAALTTAVCVLLSAPAYADECTAPGKTTVDKYLQGLLPEVGSTLVAAGFIEDFTTRLESQPQVRAQWDAAVDRQVKVLQQLSESALALQEQVRMTLLMHLGQHEWRRAFALACEDYPRFAIRMSQRDAQDYIALERTTMKAALNMGVQGVPVWLKLPDEAARKAARDQAEKAAKGMPAYPFSFEGRASYSALAVLGLTKGSDDSQIQPWMQDVKRVLGKGNAYLKSTEATQLRKGVTTTVDALVHDTFQGTEREALRVTYERQMAKVFAAL
jgi:hypothetical protein